ncbi:MAG: DUF2267 domain-containing protein [Minicystis sp.]
MISYDDLVAEVQRRAGLEGPEEAERLLAVTARALGERLLPDEAGPVASALPEPAAQRIREARYERDFDIDELYDRVGRREGAGHGFGREHAQAVCQIIGESVPEAVRVRLQKHLGPSFAPLFEPRPHTSPPPRPVHASPSVEPGRGTTLATGRPGSRHPVSEAQADRAHAASIARSADPHGETKLSSSHGLTQERLRDTLAEGKPGPEKPVSDTKR